MRKSYRLVDHKTLDRITFFETEEEISVGDIVSVDHDSTHSTLYKVEGRKFRVDGKADSISDAFVYPIELLVREFSPAKPVNLAKAL